MASCLHAKQRFGEEVDIIFSDSYLQFCRFSKSKKVITIYYDDVKNLSVTGKNEATDLTFYGKDFIIFENGIEKKTSYFSISLINEKRAIDYQRILEDRTPLKTVATKMRIAYEIFEKKYQDESNGHTKIYIKVHKFCDYRFIVDKVYAFNFYNLPYVDGYRVLTLPTNEWTIQVGGGTNEDSWSSNAVTINEKQGRVTVEIKNHFFSNPTLQITGGE